MSDEEANVAKLKDAYDRWSGTRGEIPDVFLDLVAPDVDFGSVPRGKAPSLAFAKAYKGREALREYFAGLNGGWSMVHYTIDHYVAQGDCVFARGSCAWTNKTTGKVAETPKVDFWRFKDGKATEFYEYFDTAHVAAAAV
jgi:ketosteroid isomerase-like protein